MGYKKVKVSDHPYAMDGGYVYEHRLIMEQKLGRHLEPHEHVHHKDGNRDNNDPKNLEHCPTPKDHYEQHSLDDDHMINLLIRYADVHGRLPSKRECDEHRELPNSSTYRRHFGSWSEAKALAQQKIDMINESDEWGIMYVDL